MSTAIYYFSGTGNSLHVARELQKRISETELIPIISLLDKEVIETKAETVGFVFPIYLSTVPVPVRRFLKKLDLNKTRYIFAVPTHGGFPGPCFPTIYIEKLLKKKGENLDSSMYLHMANNTPTGLVPPSMPGFKERVKNWVNEITSEKIAALDTEVRNRLDIMAKVITNQKKYPEKGAPHPFYYFLEHFMSAITGRTKTVIKFYTDPECSGCGICEKVCLSQKIKVIYDNPVWKKEIQCYYCYACFNFCPTQSILVKDAYTDQNGRYSHPEITAGDIAGQK